MVVEYESLNSLGSRVWNRNLPSIIEGDRLCDNYGLDTISTGASIAFAMELNEKHILTDADTDLDLTWGNSDTVIELIHRITYRKELREYSRRRRQAGFGKNRKGIGILRHAHQGARNPGSRRKISTVDGTSSGNLKPWSRSPERVPNYR